MTKPHEEQWELNPIQRAAVVLKGERKTVLWAGNPLKATQPEDVERARLAVKAPHMANLLARIRDEHGAYMPSTAEDIEAVLREAGVLE